MKGIILAGGNGTRLAPVTKAVNKHLLPVYDKPMIYYPLSTLMLAGIKDILIITKKSDIPQFQSILADGSQWNINITYAVQDEPKGLAEAFIIGEEFIGNDDVALALGDNVLYKDGMQEMLNNARDTLNGAVAFSYNVSEPQHYGVIEFDENTKPISIEEKPENPKSNLAILGLYFFNKTVVEVAKNIKPSARGELEITDVLRHYMDNKTLDVVTLGRGAAWLDVGRPETLLDASQFISTIEKRQGLKISDLDEIAQNLNRK